jgi:serpin B
MLGLVVGCETKPGRPSIQPPPEVPLQDLKTATEGDIAFALDLDREIAGTGNLVFSPASISSALAMVYAGAAGKTAEEMKAVLHFSLDADKLHAVNHKRFYTWNGGDGGKRPFELSVANSLWGQKDEPWKDDFLKLMESRYAAGFHRVDFVNQNSAVRGMVNDWASQWTHGKIAELLPADLPSRETRLILANAVYFNGSWAHPFEKSNTHDADFHRADKSTIKVSMMSQTEHCFYADLEKLKVLKLPYKGDSMSLVVLLPKQIDGLAELEATLTQKEWNKSIEAAAATQVRVFIPKFKIESDFKLNNALASLGMISAFQEGQADLSGMNGKRDLYISWVIHKAMIEVSEEGTEAAAATAVGIEKSSAPAPPPAPPPEFRADHPFLFALRDEQTGDLLFIGRFAGK